MLMTAWFFLSPIIYPLEMITTMEPWIARVYFLNPMAGIVTAYRMALVGEAGPGIMYLLISFGVALCIAISGIALFRKMEDRFGDEL